jgi:asparagine synthase (glutamine-hydrolysing)
MCGICGILGNRLGAPARRAAVQEMMAALAHRGPDDSGIFESDGVTLGHRRLSVIDLETGRQPMASADGRHVIVYNGEIYNYRELRSSLIQQGIALRTNSDTEVLLELLVREGPRALARLNGMFAFALLDTTDNRWLMARDPLGIKPLYYAALPDELIFGSEPKALLAHPALRAEVNWEGLHEYLTFQFCLEDRTLFRGISKVEPGCYVEGRGSQVLRTVRYWDTDYRIDEHHTEAYFIETLRDLVDDAARLQIRSDVPLGAYLSGGLDSTVVASASARHLRGALQVFHGRFNEGPRYDESSFAAAAARAIGANLIQVTVTPDDFVEDMPRLIRAMDEPVAGPGLFPQYRVSRLAARHVKVALGGQGGDEVFGGYARYLVGYLEQAIKGAIFETQEEGQHVVTLGSIIPNLPVLREYRPLMQAFWRDGLFEGMDARYFRLIDRSPDLESILTQDARARFRREDVYARFQRTFNHPDTKSYFNKMTHFDLKTLLPALLHVEDRVSMAVSLESRVPLLDTRIVNLVTSMPPAIKFRGGRTKHVLRKAVASLIPEPILLRKDKMGFPVPLSEWMTAGPVRTFVADTLSSRRSRERGLFEPQALTALIDKEAAFGRQLWGVLCNAMRAANARTLAVGALSRYWQRNPGAIAALAMPEITWPAEEPVPPRLEQIQLPDWASDLGVAGALLIPAHRVTPGTGPASERTDWLGAACWFIHGLAERAHERAKGPIHSYSYRLNGWDPRLWDRAWANRIALFLRRHAARLSGMNEEALFGPRPPVEILLTYDIDAVAVTSSMRLKRACFDTFNAIRMLARGHVAGAGSRFAAALRFAVRSGSLWHLDEAAATALARGLRSHFFVYGRARTHSPRLRIFDPEYDIADSKLASTLRALAGRSFGLGLHQSFDSWRDPIAMRMERQRVEEHVGLKIHSCRQHWLRFSWADTWEAQQQAGFSLDATLGFNDRPGFRNGAALRMRPWSERLDAELSLESLPIVLMDSHLYDYAEHNDRTRAAAIEQWLGEVQHVGGAATIIVHPHTLGPEYGWRPGFEAVLDRLAANR